MISHVAGLAETTPIVHMIREALAIAAERFGARSAWARSTKLPI